MTATLGSSRRDATGSSKQLFQRLTVIREGHGPVVWRQEMFVGIDAQRPVNGGVIIGHGHRMLDNLLAEAVGRADHAAAFDAPSEHDATKCVALMSAAALPVELSWTSEVGSYYHEGAIQHLSLL